MIEDLIELAHARDLVVAAELEPDGTDRYELRTAPRPATVWVRPDGRFSRAEVGGDVVSVGLVAGLVRRGDGTDR